MKPDTRSEKDQEKNRLNTQIKSTVLEYLQDSQEYRSSAELHAYLRQASLPMPEAIRTLDSMEDLKLISFNRSHGWKITRYGTAELIAASGEW